jgi:preprotein translocase subunit YajC
VIPIGLMAPPPGQGQASAYMQFLPLVLIFGIFYFLLIRPARKRQKQVQQMLDDLKSGDRVVTSGGLLGTVVEVDRATVQVRIADNVKVKITKSAVVGLQEAGAPSSTES